MVPLKKRAIVRMTKALDKRRLHLQSDIFWTRLHQKVNCKLCQSPDRATYEEEYLNWRAKPEQIAQALNMTEGYVTCHMRAKGFWDARKNNLVEALDEIVTLGLTDPEPRLGDAVRALDLMAQIRGLKNPEQTGQTSVRITIQSSIPDTPDVKEWHAKHPAPEDAEIVVELQDVKALPEHTTKGLHANNGHETNGHTNGHTPPPPEMPGLNL